MSHFEESGQQKTYIPYLFKKQAVANPRQGHAMMASKWVYIGHD